MTGLIPRYDPILFGEIHQVSTFLPRDENEDSIRCILFIAGAIAAIHLILLSVFKLWIGSTKSEGGSVDEKRAASLAPWKASYQLTNLLVNLGFGCLGIYYQANHVPWGESIMNKIVGYEHVKLFAVGQVGYQLWALPIGMYIGETKSMIMHHIAVICVGSVSTFVRCGFRYYTPYFYGLIEISSVPLSVMNAFKNNKHWIKAYPELYSTVRLVFGITFLGVRVVLWTPYYWSFFYLASMLLYSSENTSTKVILTCFISSSLVLTMLQYFWATKIISALVKVAPKKKGN
ncbi:hypothetical protein ACHAXR_013425 [Thalassiosira sp. AJA248-18]